MLTMKHVSFGGSPLTHSSRLLLKSVSRQKRIKEFTCLSKEELAKELANQWKNLQISAAMKVNKNDSLA